MHLPVGEARAFALFAHCFTCGKDLRVSTRIADMLSSHGFGVLRFDFTGLGKSAGQFEDTNFSSNVSDLTAAADFMRTKFSAPQILVGHSLGGAAVLAAASRIPEALAVATVGAPADPTHVKHLFDAHRPAIEESGEAMVSIGGRPFRIKQQFLNDLGTHAGTESISKLGRALLVLHSPQDNIVGVEQAAAIYGAARHPKSFISLDGADHLLSNGADAVYVARTIAAWCERYILDERAPVGEVPGGTVQVAIGDGFETTMGASGHALVADEPRSVGGSNLGPNPYDYLLSALGACTVMTLRMYADRKSWALEGASAVLSHARVHRQDSDDCDDCDSGGARIDRIDMELKLDGELSAEQREKLMEIATRCPVHRTLLNDKEIHIVGG